MRSDKQRIQEILTQTIVSLCNSGLSFETELSVEGLLGITLDKADVFLVNIKEVISLAQSAQETSISSSMTSSSPAGQQQQTQPQPQSPRQGVKRRRTEEDDVHPQQTMSMSPSFRLQQHADLPLGMLLPFKQEPSIWTPPMSSPPLGVVGSASPQAMSVSMLSGLHRRSLSTESTYLAAAGPMTSPPPPPSHTLPRSHSHSSDSHSLPADDASRPVSVDSDVVIKEEPEDSYSGRVGPGSAVGLLLQAAGSHQLARPTEHGFDPTASGTAIPLSPVHGVPASSTAERGRLSTAPTGLPAPRLFGDPQQQSAAPVSIHTVRAYIRDVKRIKTWLREVRGEMREMEDIPVPTLDGYFAEMWSGIRKKDGNDYELSSLQQMKSSLDRHLRERTNGRISLATPGFDLCHEALLRKRSALRKQREAHGTVAATSTTPVKDGGESGGLGLRPRPGPIPMPIHSLGHSPGSVPHPGPPTPGSPRTLPLTSVAASVSAAPPMSPLHIQARPREDNRDNAQEPSLPGPAFFLKHLPP